MLSPQRALLCNLNHIHLQHVSLGLHLSRRPELREGPLSTPPPPGDTGGKESRGPCSGALVDANSNSPAVPCRCCQEHGPGLENRQDPAREEEGAASPSDPGCSSSLSSCSDLSPDESPISVYSRGLPGDEDVHPQPSIVPLEQGSPLGSVGPGACSPDSFCCSPDSCSGASSPPGPGLDSNCNALTTCQEPPSPGPEEEDDGGELDLPASELPEADDDGKADAGKTEPSWKINPIWKIDTEAPGAGWKAAESSDSGCSIAGDSRPAQLDSGWAGRTAVTDGSSRTDAGWRSDVSEEPAAHRTITSFHELAQKRRRGPGLPLAPQVKKDRSDWLIVFSPDSELPPSGSLGGCPAPPREVTTFKELRSRSRAPPPPVPPRDPPAGWALVPPRPPPPPVPPRRRKNRPGLQPIAERPPEEGRAGSPAAGQEAPAAREPEEPGAQAGPGLPPPPPAPRSAAAARPLLEGAGAAGTPLPALPAGPPRAELRLLGAPRPPQKQLLPVRLSPVGAHSPPARGALPCLASPELALLLSPLFPRSSTFPAVAPPPCQVPAPPLPAPPRPPKAPRRTRSPPPPPRLPRSSWSFAGAPGAQRRWMAEAQSGPGQLQEQKKGLLIAVSASVDKIISHFGAARNLVQKAQLGDSRLSPDVGHLVLTTLCPALHALVADGLKPFRKDLITGQRRSSPWSVVEASVKPGASSRALGTLYSQVSRLAPLSSSRSRFHAFILGLLNTKQLELWFSSLQEDAGLLSLLYLPTGFLSLARGGCPALSTELLLLLQPLSVLTFHLDLLFEHHHHLPLGPPPAAEAPGSPPALQQTVHAVLHWGGRLAQSLRGASGETPPGPRAPASAPTSGSWWEQLTQASRVYASGGSEGFPLPRWRSWRPGPAAGGPQARPVPTEDAAPGRGLWLGRLFGVPGSLAETDGGPVKSRRPSSWLPPTVSVLALVKRGAPPEPLSPPEELEASAASLVQTHRAVRALCDHAAAGPDQLSFRRGEVLRVVATVDEDWLRCGRDGAEGLVPVGYTSLVL
ncbi:RUN and SH3 domain-containing protein 1 isoform X2 [Mustela putorius furo]|uniref:RUN and SH3 domain-containing protein 1 isoform X2 n=2 Tax=Mustela putorius furo TaxID=9669 RepID=A0A8U0SHF2_MUSPF|nr:RUN and SH3 domain-containing protein 1 isoform X2 [Mustela putorius furo]